MHFLFTYVRNINISLSSFSIEENFYFGRSKRNPTKRHRPSKFLPISDGKRSMNKFDRPFRYLRIIRFIFFLSNEKWNFTFIKRERFRIGAAIMN